MTVYAYRCPDHGEITLDYPRGEHPSSTLCPDCMSTCKRVFSFQMAPVMHPHKDVATGEVISSHRARRDHLKRLSDEHSERLGFENTYVEADLSDKRAMGVYEEGETRPPRPKPDLTKDKEFQARLAGEISKAL